MAFMRLVAPNGAVGYAEIDKRAEAVFRTQDRA